eukprot:1213518-Alexandrium_andersonii.AAC.1
MGPGDWACPACGDRQFARNAACRRCGELEPASPGGALSRRDLEVRARAAQRSSPEGRDRW